MKSRETNNPSRKPKHRRLLAVTVLLVVSGCVIPIHRSVVNEVPLNHIMRVTRHFPMEMYRLSAGDVLEFLYLTIPTVTKTPYRIAALDQLDLEFGYHPELNRAVRVRPDGKISIPHKPDLYVAGLTVDQLRSKLKQIYNDVLRDPEVTVTLREFNAKKEEIQKAMASGPCNKAREVRIAPDGSVALPLISHMQAEGLSVPELTNRVNAQYNRLIGEVKVSILLKEINGNVAFIDGQVAKPGVYKMTGRRTVQQVIALAGGTTTDAEPRTVLVVSKTSDGLYISRTCDLTNLSSRSDLQLRAGDLIYVPRSRISRADVWVEQNIQRLLLFGPWNLGLRADLGRVTRR